MDSSLCISAISKPFVVVAVVAVFLCQHTVSSLVSCLDFDKSLLSFHFIWIMSVHRCSHWVRSWVEIVDHTCSHFMTPILSLAWGV